MPATEQIVTHLPEGEGRRIWMVNGPHHLQGYEQAQTEVHPLRDARPTGRQAAPTRPSPGERKLLHTGEPVRVPGREPLGSGRPRILVRATKDCLHTLKNTGDSVGKLLVLAVPAGLDKFFEEADKLGTGISSPLAPPDAKKLLAAERHGIESPPPPAQ